MSQENGNASVEDYQRLKRGLLRIAFSYRGQSPAYDEHLKSLGKAIRLGAPDEELRGLIDDTVNRVVALADAGESRGSLERLIRLLKVPGQDRSRMLTGLKDETLDGDELIEATARAINNMLNASGATQPQPPFELREGLKAVLEALPLKPKDEETLERRLEQALIERHGDFETVEFILRDLARIIRAGFETGTSDITESGGKVGDPVALLNLLLERIPFPKSADRDLQALRRDLGAARTPGDLNLVTLRLAELIADVKQSAQRELTDLGDLLKRITSDLIGLQQSIERSGDAHAATVDDSRALGKSIDAQVEQLHSDIERSNSLEEVRATVSAHLGDIAESLGGYVDAQAERHEHARSENQQLASRVKELEDETTDLRKLLAIHQEQAVVDPLTRIPNRLGFEQQLGEEEARRDRNGQSLAVAIIDIDHFKQINDRFGHSAGDKVLMAVAKQMRDSIRRTDRVARYGGEEFVVLLPATNLKAGFLAMDKLRDLIANCQFHYKDERVPVTVSIGIAEFGDGETFQSVFERADEALYKAKDHGRNQVQADGAAVSASLVSAAAGMPAA